MGRRIPTMIPRSWRGATAVVGTLLVGAALLFLERGGEPPVAGGSAGEEAVLEAYAAGRSDQWLEAEGRVSRVLSDDNEGSRHQRFIIELAGGHTVLIAHNIDLAPRVPLRVDDRVTLRGEYEWNDRGGVIHWTHHDPAGRHRGGWIRHDGKTYR